MSDLISRQAVLDAVNDCGICIQKILDIPSAELETFEFCSGGDNPCKEYDQEKHCCHRWTKVIRQTVEEMKSAEPERKTGKWEVQPSTGEDRPFIWWKCSECGHVIFSETERDRREFHAFCGRCGADMRGE